MSKKSAKPVSSEKGQNSASNYLAKPAIRLGHDVDYDGELARLQIELVKLQEWIRHKGLRVVVLFEGRDAAGKGGAIKRIAEALNPRICRIAALAAPTEREQTQWYFQRYVSHLPAAGEMVLFDRSWYNRAGVEHVMGFCTERAISRVSAKLSRVRTHAPAFRHSARQVLVLCLRRGAGAPFPGTPANPTKRWKLSPMDLESRRRWADYSRAKDEMFAVTDTRHSPWFVVNSDDKKSARLNVIRHLLSLISYRDLTPERLELPALQKSHYVRPPLAEQTFIPEPYLPKLKSTKHKGHSD